MATDRIKLVAASNHPRGQEILNILTLLGMSSQLEIIESDLKVYDLLKQGLPRQSLQSLVEKTDLALGEISIGLDFSERKLRNLLSPKDGSLLTPFESVAVWQFASVFAIAEEVFGRKDLVRR